MASWRRTWAWVSSVTGEACVLGGGCMEFTPAASRPTKEGWRATVVALSSSGNPHLGQSTAWGRTMLTTSPPQCPPPQCTSTSAQRLLTTTPGPVALARHAVCIPFSLCLFAGQFAAGRIDHQSRVRANACYGNMPIQKSRSSRRVNPMRACASPTTVTADAVCIGRYG